MAEFLPQDAEETLAQSKQGLDEAISAREAIDLLSPDANTIPQSVPEIDSPDGYTDGFGIRWMICLKRKQ